MFFKNTAFTRWSLIVCTEVGADLFGGEFVLRAHSLHGINRETVIPRKNIGTHRAGSHDGLRLSRGGSAIFDGFSHFSRLIQAAPHMRRRSLGAQYILASAGLILVSASRLHLRRASPFSYWKCCATSGDQRTVFVSCSFFLHGQRGEGIAHGWSSTLHWAPADFLQACPGCNFPCASRWPGLIAPAPLVSDHPASARIHGDRCHGFPPARSPATLSPPTLLAISVVMVEKLATLMGSAARKPVTADGKQYDATQWMRKCFHGLRK